jgi:hypothetical protein
MDTMDKMVFGRACAQSGLRLSKDRDFIPRFLREHSKKNDSRHFALFNRIIDEALRGTA